MFCTNCGAPLPDRARFCNQCGQAVRASVPRTCLSCGAGLGPGEFVCKACGNRHQACPQCGRLLPEAALSCSDCGRLLRVAPGYALVPGELEHPSMQQVNQTLRQSLVLNQVAEMVSEKVGKPWYESCFNSVQATEKQYGRLFELALIAAQRVGFTHLPAVYVEADRGYQSNTYGLESDAFVNVGMFLPKLLVDRELLFILGHEFGHLLCRHALWTTVSMFLCGQARGNLLSEGLLGYLSNPFKILESGVESVILNWMRVADLTADRVALLVCGDIAVARRTLFLLYFKSRRELGEVDVEAWARQQESQDVAMAKMSQLMSSSTPYLGLRLRALGEFYASPRYAELQRKVDAGCGLDLAGLFDDKGGLRKYAKRPGNAGPAQPPRRVPESAPAGSAVPLPPKRKVQAVTGSCPKCGHGFALPLVALPRKPSVELQCKACGARYRVKLGGLRPPPEEDSHAGTLSPDKETS